jgi:hypothetical protein
MSEKVDLSLAKPGDTCQYPDGTWGVITAWLYGDGHPWWASRGADGKEYAHNREGRRDRECQLEFDIICVLRDRKQVTPRPTHYVHADGTAEAFDKTAGPIPAKPAAENDPRAEVNWRLSEDWAVANGARQSNACAGMPRTKENNWVYYDWKMPGPNNRLRLKFYDKHGQYEWDHNGIIRQEPQTQGPALKFLQDFGADVTPPATAVPDPVFEDDEGFNKLWGQKQKCLEKIQAMREHDYTVGESALPKVADALESVVDYAAHVFDHITQSA